MIFNEYLEVNKNAGIKKPLSKPSMRERERDNFSYLHEGCISAPVKLSFNFLNLDSSRLTGSTFPPAFWCRQLYKSSAVNVKNGVASFCGCPGFTVPLKWVFTNGLSIVEACILDKVDC